MNIVMKIYTISFYFNFACFTREGYFMESANSDVTFYNKWKAA